MHWNDADIVHHKCKGNKAIRVEHVYVTSEPGGATTKVSVGSVYGWKNCEKPVAIMDIVIYDASRK